jgi:hypothetical protein
VGITFKGVNEENPRMADLKDGGKKAHSSQILLKQKIHSYSLLDLEQVNEKTCRGIHGCDVEDLTTRLVEVFEKFKMNKKNSHNSSLQLRVYVPGSYCYASFFI